jgi:hypothetical protein
MHPETRNTSRSMRMKKQSQHSPKKITTTWDLKRLFENDDDPKIENNTKTVEQKNHAFINKWKDRKDYLNDPAVLRKALDEYEALKKKYGTDGDADTISGFVPRLTAIY